MSHIFGKVIRVVHDIEPVLRHWIENLGIGPWFYRELVPLDSFTYRGEPSDLKMSIALSYSGDMQFELIQPRNDAPLGYQMEQEGFISLQGLFADVRRGAAPPGISC